MLQSLMTVTGTWFEILQWNVPVHSYINRIDLYSMSSWQDSTSDQIKLYGRQDARFQRTVGSQHRYNWNPGEKLISL
ncbi:hypothetical protein MPTK1_3g05090 [Marchantia polymorpha subsp. ruderalis]|uniref:Uncharacterized protein n=2 Tax=Marchantia polymorpha TaxID=3197 RepID=A0AAF6AXK5_MARPO|nr:hypothetical protein MARPO_0022s0019 [Marchantia polymorpha]BBN04489.1 hypothetical protein Mp_3g05090 [Marchantia polymorpha subsp. ruderalis]|eukprot:PTQ43911.1 hypothetical protein MARPO_0022s0019 [Marchantia polymorpha]